MRPAAIDADILRRTPQRLGQCALPLAQQINRRHNHQRRQFHLGNRHRADQRFAAPGGQHDHTPASLGAPCRQRILLIGTWRQRDAHRPGQRGPLIEGDGHLPTHPHQRRFEPGAVERTRPQHPRPHIAPQQRRRQPGSLIAEERLIERGVIQRPECGRRHERNIASAPLDAHGALLIRRRWLAILAIIHWAFAASLSLYSTRMERKW